MNTYHLSAPIPHQHHRWQTHVELTGVRWLLARVMGHCSIRDMGLNLHLEKHKDFESRGQGSMGISQVEKQHYHRVAE